VVVSRANFGCGSSREHAPWALEVNGINVVIAENFGRIFRQNMFNCGMLAIEMPEEQIRHLFDSYAGKDVELSVDVGLSVIRIECNGSTESMDFQIADFDKALVKSGGWVEYADQNY